MENPRTWFSGLRFALRAGRYERACHQTLIRCLADTIVMGMLPRWHPILAVAFSLRRSFSDATFRCRGPWARPPWSCATLARRR